VCIEVLTSKQTCAKIINEEGKGKKEESPLPFRFSFTHPKRPTGTRPQPCGLTARRVFTLCPTLSTFARAKYKCLRRISRKKRGLGAVCAERQDCSCLKDSPSSTYIQSLSFYLIRTLLLLSLLLFVLFNYPEINTQTVYGYKS